MYGRRNLFSNMDNAMRAFNKIGNELSKGVTFETGGFNPRVDILENEQEIRVHFEIAGVKKEDVNISINDDMILTIRGTRKAKFEEEEKSYLRREISYGEFSRSFQLPDEIESDNIKAKFIDGVLNVTIPKKAPQEPKEINVQIN